MRKVVRIGRKRGRHTGEFCSDRLTQDHCASTAQLGYNRGIGPWLMPSEDR